MLLGINNIPILKVVLPFLAGIFLMEACSIENDHLISFILFLVIYSVLSISVLTTRVHLLSSYLILTFFLLGITQLMVSNPRLKSNHFSNFKEAKFLFVNVIETKQLSSSLRAVCEVKYSGSAADSLLLTTGKLMVYFSGPNSNNITLGSSVLTSSKYFDERTNSNPHVFDYKKYLNYRGIFHRMHLKHDEYYLLEGNSNSIKTYASRSRDKCIAIFDKHLKSKNAMAVASAMVLGERNLLNDELYEAFTDTGAVHVLAVSGLHVGIVSGFILILFRFIKESNKAKRGIELVLSLVGVWGFALLTGAAAAVTRAAIMFSLFFIGKAANRTANSYNILAAAAFIMLLYDPNYLFQAGFQFSFLALTGIIFFYPKLRGLINSKYRIITLIWEMISVSISAQLLVSPLAIFYFHKLPTYFWFTGLAAIPAAFLILLLGIILLLMDSSIGSQNVLTELIATAFESTIEIFNTVIFTIQDLPFCSADDLWLSTASLCVIYLALLSLSLYLKTKRPLFVILFFGLLLGQSLMHQYENHLERAEKKLIVYDIYNESLTDLFYEGQLKELSIDILNKKQVDYITYNNRLAGRIIKPDKEDTLRLTNLDRFYLFDNKLVLLYPTKKSLNYTTNQPIDLMVLSQKSYKDLTKIASKFQIKLLVIDGTLGKEKYKLKRQAESLGIPVHTTSTDGALEFPI